MPIPKVPAAISRKKCTLADDKHPDALTTQAGKGAISGEELIQRFDHGIHRTRFSKVLADLK